MMFPGFDLPGWRKPPFAFLTLLSSLLLAVAPRCASAGNNTTASLIAESGIIAPGEHFTVGVHLRMNSGWHIYWANPGESGIPTQVKWTLPDGFTAGEIQWPLPEKHIEAGDVLTYGYEDEVVLLVSIAAPSSLSAGQSVKLAADVSWLECAQTCVPGDAKVDLTLKVGTRPGPGPDAPLIRAWRQKLPRPPTPREEQSTTVRFDRDSLVLTVDEALSEADLYPVPPAVLTVGRTSVRTMPGATEFIIPLTFPAPIDTGLTLHGIVVDREKGKMKGREVAISVPREVCRSLSPAGQGGSSVFDESFTPQAGYSSTGSIALYILFAILGGLLLNIMPCVLPVIALKVFGLVKMAGDKPERVKRLGWSFAAGIITSFAALALVVVILQFAGQQVGWGFQFQEPLFVIAMAAVVFAFGLSLFGVYEIRMPGSAVDSISASLARREGEEGYLASFSEGVFATILATPCTAPFLGSALGFAFAQPWWMIILIFLLVGFGMALPYLLLTARPAWQRYLPKPGAWMETAKQFMGFLMMATLLWLLYVLGKQLGMEAVIWTGAFLLTVGVAAWLVGRFATLTASPGRSRIVWISALLIVALGYYVFLESALNVRSVIAGVASSAASPTKEKGGIAWEPFSRESLEEALRTDRPVFVDFTAEWCLTCKVNEHTALRDDSVVKAFSTLNVAAFKADWTNRNPEITSLLAKFGRSGVPLYVIFPPRDRRTPTVLPEVVTADIVRDAVEKASAR
jgi:thiol:disulfide interchange protein/DsbC/DsbD-like thiol-disulfide interchange protein